MQQIGSIDHLTGAWRRHLTRSRPRVAYLEAGDANASECVLFIHGVGSSASTWQRLLAALERPLRVIAPDLRGHGESEWPGGPCRLCDLVGDVARLVDELELDRVHVVGFSIGAVIAEAFALSQPGRVATLTLLNSIAGRLAPERARALQRLQDVRTLPPAQIAQASAERWFTEAFRRDHPELVDEEVAIVSAVRPEPYAAVYEVLATAEIVDEVAAITAPTLIVTGEHDAGSTPRMSGELYERIRDSELHIVPGLRHYLHIEAAPTIAGLIDDFIAAHPIDGPPPHDPTGT